MKSIQQLSTKVLSVFLAVLMIMTALPSLPLFATDITETNETSNVGSSVNLVKDTFEVEEFRDETVKHFRLEDGSYIAAQYEKPIHFKDNNGKWQDIDNTLAVSGGDITTKNDRIKFAKKITGNEVLLTIHENNHKITMSLDGAIKKTVGAIINNESDNDSTVLQKMLSLDNLSAKVLYKNILDGVDLEYIVDSYDIKENIIVKERAENYTYTFTMRLNNLNARLDEKGQIIVTDSSTGNIEYIIPAPTACDAKGVYADDSLLYYTLNVTGTEKYSLTVNVDAAWMNSIERSYPVIIDPPISVPSSTMTDLDICSTSPDRTSPYDTTMYVSSTWKGYWKTSSLPVIPESAYITNAQLSLQSTSNTRCYIGAYQVTSNWDSTLTWNKTLSTTAEGKLSTTLLDYNGIDDETVDENGRYYWDITSLVRSWYSGTANYGIGFQPVSGTAATTSSVFYTSDKVDMSTRPKFIITYKDMKGVESYWTYATQDAGLAGTGSINYATGVLTFSKSLLSTTDSLMPYTPMIVYSSAIAGTANDYPNTQVSYWRSYMPLGFKININETIIQKKYASSNGEDVDYYVWSDGDGTEHYFLPVNNSTTTFKDEDGLLLTLSVSSSVCTITDSAKTIRTFNKLSSTATSEVLSGWYLTSITDANNNKIVFTFESGPRPTGVSLIPNGSSQID